MRIASTDRHAVESLRDISARYPGGGKLLVYLSDLKKLTALKGASNVDISDKLLSELYKACGEDNVRFRR